MIKHAYWFILFLLMCFRLHGQLNTEPYEHMDRRAIINPLYNYQLNFLVHIGVGEGWRVDTLNYCRVRKSRIKSVKVYRFSSATDSVLVSDIQYDSTGMTSGMRSVLDPVAVRCINCDSVKSITYKPSEKIVNHAQDKKMVVRTDSSGYIIKYRNASRGFVQRLVNSMLSNSDFRIEYVYDSSYRCVTAYTYFNRYFLGLRKWDKYHTYRSVYCVDEHGNALSDFMYRRTEQGGEELLWGFRYVYEFY